MLLLPTATPEHLPFLLRVGLRLVITDFGQDERQQVRQYLETITRHQ